ncbi:hypothetical protein [Neobacillus vireti]|uniref:hypothetical protein n=1 Tax=Neobacillus vireti TaxID=220686 RepID=UPI002FFD8F69
MFDPTAFDNMKVVIEGALYDLDLEGKIAVIDRNDFVNTAKMSRSFELYFTLPDSHVTALIEIRSELMNLAAELLTNFNFQKEPGCYIKLQFLHQGITNKVHLKNILSILIDIWGDTRKISQSITINHSESTTHNVNSIVLDRLVREDQMEDMVELIDTMVLTLEQLQSYLGSITSA